MGELAISNDFLLKFAAGNVVELTFCDVVDYIVGFKPHCDNFLGIGEWLCWARVLSFWMEQKVVEIREVLLLLVIG